MSYYITAKMSPAYHQMTLEEFMNSEYDRIPMVNDNVSNTKTYKVESISDRFRNRVDVDHLIRVLDKYNERYADLRAADRRSLYHSFKIPKKSGGLRQIDAPLDELSDALRDLKRIFESQFFALYHTSAFAYVKHRCHLDAVKRHQCNASKWFLKLDAHNFFGSTTKDFVMYMMAHIFPFCLIMEDRHGREALSTALDLAFLDGVLPQGTPLSPMLTNVMMIPIDYTLSNGLRDHDGTSYVYTRYADDIIISSKYSFKFTEITSYVEQVFAQFNAPFTLNREKTRYGSLAGRNWNLGVMLNKDNEITVGHRRKKQFQNMLAAYAKDRFNGVRWDLHDIQAMEGLRNYYRQVEGEAIDRIVKFVGDKFGLNLVACIREDLKAAT